MLEHTKIAIGTLLNDITNRIGIISSTTYYEFIKDIQQKFNIKILPIIIDLNKTIDDINKEFINIKKQLNEYNLIIVKDIYDFSPKEDDEYLKLNVNLYYHKLLCCLPIKQIDYVEKNQKTKPSTKVIDMEYGDLGLVDMIVFED